MHLDGLEAVAVELGGVLQQVAHRPFERLAAAADHRLVGVDLDLPAGAPLHPLRGAPGHGGEHHRFLCFVAAPGEGELDQLVDQVCELASLTLDVVDEPVAGVGGELVDVVQHAGVGAQAGQRGSQLVGGVLHQPLLGLGITHVGEGADHLLFLLMLLIPAPLVVAGGRWRAGQSARRSVVRVVHVVTAFAVGHSLTLALAATGVIDVPTRPVETLIAFSIAVSAVHAIRPLVARGEMFIAGGFGLVHGLASASLIGDLGLDGGSLVTTLLGFNLGIELTQLLVVALMMPSLIVLARTPVYPAFRVGVAAVGLLFSVSWMLERAALTSSDPFEAVQTWLVEHPLLVASGVAALAVVARLTAPEAATDTRSGALGS